MKKWKAIFLKARPKFIGCVILVLIAIIQLFVSYGYYNYKHIPLETVNSQIYFEVNPKLVKNNEKPACNYDNVLHKSTSISSKDILPNIGYTFSPNGIVNGSYNPVDCNPLLSVAILVTYRNRQSQLDIFIPFMHNFLRKQNIHYKIYVIEQEDEKPWNKGMLYNIGAKYAIADKFPCLILHDVDLLPLDEGNLYACLQHPRHMSASIDKLRYVLLYETLVGGVLAIQSNQYAQLNGFSNRFKGWGGEDDDFAANIFAHNLKILRLPPYISRYTMLPHKPEEQNADRYRIMDENIKDRKKDGMNSVRYKSISIKNQRLFTLIGVKL